MAEYSREQRNQLNRAIANSSVESKQLKGFIDNRIIQRTIKNRIHGVDNSTQRKVSQLLRVKLPPAPGAPATLVPKGPANIAAITAIITGLYPGANAAAVTSCATNLDNDINIHGGQQFIYLDISENGDDRRKLAGSFSHCTGTGRAGVVTAFWKRNLRILMVGTHGGSNGNYIIRGATNANMLNKHIGFAP